MSTPAGQGLPRVLISAYACGPGLGSEPGAGWAVVKAAARHARVWVMTRERFAPAIAQALAADSFLASRVRPVYVDLPDRFLKAKRRHRDVYWYYPLWQREVARVARRLHQEHHFTLLHHATFAVDWMPSGLASLAREVPLVWGPVGGASYVPPELWRWLGVRGTVHEMLRSAATRTVRRLTTGPTAGRAALTVALNADTARRFGHAGEVVIAPNAVFDDDVPDDGAAAAHVRGGHAGDAELNALFVGRLVAWKGVRLALAAVAENPQWSLTFVGEGPEREWLESAARKQGLEQRVRFLGQLERPEVLALMGLADALLFPSLHDSCGWVVGEAMTRGLPVVCVDLGGPPAFLADHSQAVPVGRDVVADLCDRLDTIRLLSAGRGAGPAREGATEGVARGAWIMPDPASWTQEAFTERVGEWYRRALAAHPAPSGRAGAPSTPPVHAAPGGALAEGAAGHAPR